MTKTELTGEARHAARRRRFWLSIVAFLLVGAVVGFFVGLGSGYSGVEITAIPALAIAAVVVGNIGFIALSVWFYRSVDELEVADNLWGSLYAFYFYAAAFPSWWALEQTGVLPPVDPWAIYIATLVFGFAVYGIRKLLNR